MKTAPSPTWGKRMLNKKECRKEALCRRSGMTMEERTDAGRRIAGLLFADSAYRNAERILIYASYRDEVPTYEIMEQAWRDGKQVFCPKIEDSPEPETTAGGKKKTMTFYRVFCRDELVKGYQGIPEPGITEGRSWEGSSGKDLILMPGTAFDRERRRLGYGGGFYDQFLQNACSAVKIAVCFNCQVLPELPEEENDVRPDRILTEEGWI